jgi:protein phosphatase 2C family protein 2/3
MSALFSIESGFGEAQGRRDTMEDAHVVFDDILQVENIGITTVPGQRVSFYGVYDGHGGVNTAKLVQAALHKNIVANPKFAAGDIQGALTEGFLETDEAIVSTSNQEGWMNGSTGVVAVVADTKVYIANVGDSEACLVSEVDGELVTENLTTPHKANDPIEKKRVEDLGGHVFFGRVFGALAVSRSFGDSKFKKPKTAQNFVSCEPALHVTDIKSNHKFMILACDGLWDVMTHAQAAAFVKDQIKEGHGAKTIAAALVAEALRKKTEDNVTVIIVLFHQAGAAADALAPSETTHTEDAPSATQEASPAETPAPAETSAPTETSAPAETPAPSDLRSFLSSIGDIPSSVQE